MNARSPAARADLSDASGATIRSEAGRPMTKEATAPRGKRWITSTFTDAPDCALALSASCSALVLTLLNFSHPAASLGAGARRLPARHGLGTTARLSNW